MADFTPEVATGGWQVAVETDHETGVACYVLDPTLHDNEGASLNEIGNNMTLIAAAPRLYRALKAVMPYLSPYESGYQELAEAEAIIDWIERETHATR